jgi:hypothetical protein
VGICNPNLKKLDPRTISGHFIRYVVHSKEFRFYCFSHSTRIVESINTKFLEDSEYNGSAYPQKIELKEAQELAEVTSSKGRLIVLKKIKIDYLEP